MYYFYIVLHAPKNIMGRANSFIFTATRLCCKMY